MASPPDAPHAELSTDFEVVIVSYKSRGHVEALLRDVPRSQSIVIVDNAGGADQVADVLRDRPAGRSLDGGGRGFAHAVNVGVRSSAHEYVVLANPDSRPSPADWSALVEQLAADPGLASCGALTLDRNGQPELGVGGWEPTLLRSMVHAAGLHKLLPRAGIYAKPKIGERLQLDWLSGACLAVRRQALLDVGGLDERFFVYSEDMELGRRFRDAGWRQSVRTDVLVQHSAAGSGAGSHAMLRMRGASMALYLDTHNTRASALLMRAVLALGALVRVPFCLLLGRNDWTALHLRYAQGVLSGRAPLPNT